MSKMKELELKIKMQELKGSIKEADLALNLVQREARSLQVSFRTSLPTMYGKEKLRAFELVAESIDGISYSLKAEYIRLDKALAARACQARWDAFVKENPLCDGKQYEITFPEGVNPLKGDKL